MGSLVAVGIIAVVGVFIGAPLLNPESKWHKRFCSRCKRRAEYMQ